MKNVNDKSSLDLVGIAFVLEALILSENMRDKRLTDLEQEQVENLALELYQSIDKMRAEGDGYYELCDGANKIISKHLSSIDKEAS